MRGDDIIDILGGIAIAHKDDKYVVHYLQEAAAEIRRLREYQVASDREIAKLREDRSRMMARMAEPKVGDLTHMVELDKAKAAGRNEEWERPCVCGHIAYWRCGECGRNRKRAEETED